MKDDPKRTPIERDGGGLEPYRGPWAFLAPIRAGREYLLRRIMALIARFRPRERERPLTAAELDALLLGPLPPIEVVGEARVAALPPPPNAEHERLRAAWGELRQALEVGEVGVDGATAILVRGDRAERVVDLLGERHLVSFAPPDAVAAYRRAFLEASAPDRPRAASIDVVTLPDDPRLGIPDHVLAVALDAAALRARLAHFARIDARGRARGSASLAIALGALRYPDGASPLALFPVHLHVGSDGTHRAVAAGGGPHVHAALRERLRREGLDLPPLPEGVVLDRWFDEVAGAIADRAGWSVDRDLVALTPTSVHRAAAADLAEAVDDAADLANHPVLAPLLLGRFPPAPDAWPAQGPLDEVIERAALRPVLPQDAAQAAVSVAACTRPALLVQGAPGTGKTRSIANLLATAAARGWKALVVADRPGALDDVWVELRDAGLGALLLPLHAERADGEGPVRTVLAALTHPPDPGPPPPPADVPPPDDLLRTLHTPVGRSGLTPYTLFARVAAHPDLPPLDVGTVGADIPLDDRASRLDRLLEIAGEIEAWIAEHGVIGDHPYRHVGIDALTPALERRWQDGLDLLRRAADALERALGRLPATLFGATSPTIRDIDALVDLATALTAVLAAARVDFADDAWRLDRAALRAAATAALDVSSVRAANVGVVAPEAWDETADSPDELDALYDGLERRQDPVYRMFDERYRTAAEGIRAFLPLDARPDPRVLRAAVVALRDHAHARRRFDAARAVWLAALPASDGIDAAARIAPAVLSLCDRLDALPRDLAADALASLPALGAEAIAEVAGDLADARDAMRQGLSEAQIALRLDLPALMRPRGQGIHAARGGTPATEVLDVRALLAQVRHWLAAPDGAAAGARWRRIRVRATQAGFGRLVEAVVEGVVEPVDLAGRLRVAVERRWLDTALAEAPVLARYDRRTHQAAQEAFVAAAAAREARHRHDLVQAHVTACAAATAAGLPDALAAARRDALPLRALLERHGAAIGACHPFVTASLSAVAALLPRDLAFDLLVVDGAGAVTLAEALPAILRASRLVAFADPVTAPVPADDAGSPPPGPTLAGALAAAGAIELALTTPYRPLHPSPLPLEGVRRIVSAGERGIAFTHLPKARFDATRGVNRSEVRAVVKAVRAHALTHPERSLLVVAFTEPQAAAIRAGVDTAAAADGALAAFLAERGEPFEIVVPADAPAFTRDRVIISFGVGPDAKGDFGDALDPLRGAAGRRALDAAFTRSRTAIHAFASFTDLDVPDQPDLAPLRVALHALREDPPLPPAEPSPLEDALADALAARDFAVVRHPGALPDLTLAPANAPDRPRLALLTDGPALQAIRSADERERVLPAILRARGWKLARVSALDWVRDPEAVVAELRAALSEGRPAEPAPVRAAPLPEPWRAPALEATPETVLDALPAPRGEVALGFPPYVKADLARVVPAGMALADASPRDLARAFARIAVVEAPVHREDAFRRILAAARARTGSRIRTRLEEGLQRALASGEVVALEAHLLPPALDPMKLTPRDRGGLDAREREFAHVAAVEIDAALMAVVRARRAVVVDELLASVVKLLGFARPTEVMLQAVEARLGQLVAAQRLQLERTGEK